MFSGDFMATFLLIGASGVGKSTAAEIVSKKTNISVFDLDKILKEKNNGESISALLPKIGDQSFFNFSKISIEEIQESNDSDCLIVIGAGSINFKPSHVWYKQQNLISLFGNPNIIYERSDRKQHHPKIEGYIESEFNPARENLYLNSKYPIDVTNLTKEMAADLIIEIIKNHRMILSEL